jgi:hypothetical protein
MFCQLGNIVFQGLFGPSVWNYEGDEATYAMHELIGGKTRLNKTGDELQKLTFEIKLRVDFCNPALVLANIKTAKEAGTIMPLLLGNGKYVNDFVILSFPYEITQAFGDGTIAEAKVTLTILEYVSYNKQEQAALAARKAAFAVGNINPVIQRPPQPVSAIKGIAQSITAATQQTSKIDKLISDFKNNPVIVTANKIKESCDKAIDNLNDVQDKFDAAANDAHNIETKFIAIKTNAVTVAHNVAMMKALFPTPSINDLQNANLLLQASTNTFKSSSSGLMEKVAVRQAV